MIKNTITLIEQDTYCIQATHYFKEEQPTSAVIFYLHGGGLLFGQRDDLPNEYIHIFLEHGYTLVTLDYLLAPETKLDNILHVLKQSALKLIEQSQTLLNIDKPNVFILGRSAGAYLAILLAHQLQHDTIKGLMLFYGYYTLNDASFLYPNRNFVNYQSVTPAVIKTLIDKQPITTEKNPNRFLLYLDARQNGTWLDYLLTAPTDRKLFSLSKESLATFPPTILVHSDNDPDVPYRQSVQMNQLIPGAQLITINGNEHDFDRVNKVLGSQIYTAVAKWGKGNLTTLINT